MYMCIRYIDTRILLKVRSTIITRSETETRLFIDRQDKGNEIKMPSCSLIVSLISIVELSYPRIY